MHNLTKIAVFDFDYTIINANSSKYLNKLIIEEQFAEKKEPVRTPSISELNRFKYPEHIEKYRNDKNSTLLYNQVFKFMVTNYGATREKIEKCLKGIVISESMKKLFKILHQNGYELIIVSDSNSFVIETIIQQNGLTDFFRDRIFANKMEFDSNGHITILPCVDVEKFGLLNCVKSTCRDNICKRFVVDTFLSKKKNCSIKHIIYVGDGKIDFCPGVGLRQGDFFFIKKNSSLSRFLRDDLNKNKIKADIFYWKNSNEILKYLMVEQVDF